MDPGSKRVFDSDYCLAYHRRDLERRCCARGSLGRDVYLWPKELYLQLPTGRPACHGHAYSQRNAVRAFKRGGCRHGDPPAHKSDPCARACATVSCILSALHPQHDKVRYATVLYVARNPRAGRSPSGLSVRPGAVEWALTLQMALVAMPWPEDLLNCEAAAMVLNPENNAVRWG